VLRVRLGFTVSDAQQHTPTIEFFHTFRDILLKPSKAPFKGGNRLLFPVLGPLKGNGLIHALSPFSPGSAPVRVQYSHELTLL
jgi:hypothetical protein